MRKFVFVAMFLAAFVMIAGDKQQVSAQAAQNDGGQSASQQPQRPVVTVEKGDTLSKIAKTHSSTYQRIYDGNLQIADPNVIHPGEQVSIPLPGEQLASRTAPVTQPTPARSVAKKTSSAKKAAVTPTANTGGDVWDRIAACESGGDWSINTGNGYYGGLQFTASSWRAAGGTGLPHQASKEEQIARAQVLQARQGWGAWPACTSKLGLR